MHWLGDRGADQDLACGLDRLLARRLDGLGLGLRDDGLLLDLLAAASLSECGLLKVMTQFA